MMTCNCKTIGGTENSVMGLPTDWTVEFRLLNGSITTVKVQAHTLRGALVAWLSLRNTFASEQDILGIRKD